MYILFTPLALAHPPRHIRSKPRINAETGGLDDVFTYDDLGFGPYTQFIMTEMEIRFF